MVLIMADPKRRPGRPEIGGRVTIALGPLLARIDAVRGERSRAAWLRAAAKQALTVQADPLGPLCPCCGTPVRLWIDLNKEAQADCSACEWSTPGPRL